MKEENLKQKYTFAQDCVCEGEPDAKTVWLKVGVQSFKFGETEDAQSAEWMRDMMAHALSKIIEESGVEFVGNGKPGEQQIQHKETAPHICKSCGCVCGCGAKAPYQVYRSGNETITVLCLECYARGIEWAAKNSSAR